MLVHSGQKDFACPYCSYVTYVTHNLKKHCLTKHKVCVGFFSCFMSSPPDSENMFSGCPFAAFVFSFVFPDGTCYNNIS